MVMDGNANSDVEMDRVNYKDFWPGFTVKCEECGSERVRLENTMGWSEISGGWGELSFVCDDCGQKVDIYTNLLGKRMLL